jgi:hypothetical protein
MRGDGLAEGRKNDLLIMVSPLASRAAITRQNGLEAGSLRAIVRHPGDKMVSANGLRLLPYSRGALKSIYPLHFCL